MDIFNEKVIEHMKKSIPGLIEMNDMNYQEGVESYCFSDYIIDVSLIHNLNTSSKSMVKLLSSISRDGSMKIPTKLNDHFHCHIQMPSRNNVVFNSLEDKRLDDYYSQVESAQKHIDNIHGILERHKVITEQAEFPLSKKALSAMRVISKDVDGEETLRIEKTTRGESRNTLSYAINKQEGLLQLSINKGGFEQLPEFAQSQIKQEIEKARDSLKMTELQSYKNCINEGMINHWQTIEADLKVLDKKIQPRSDNELSL